MEYSFTQLKKEFDSLGVELIEEKLIELNLLSNNGEVTYEGILLSDQCNHRIKLVDYTDEEKVEVFIGSIIAQYIDLKEKVSIKYQLK